MLSYAFYLKAPQKYDIGRLWTIGKPTIVISLTKKIV